MKQYKHLFFDLDHTLWDFEVNAKEALKAVFDKETLLAKGVESFDSFYSHYSVHNDKLWSRYTRGYIKQSELKWKRMWLTLLDFKVADEDLSKEMSDVFLAQLPLQKSVFPYTVEILQYLKNKKYHLHLLTNGFEKTQRQKLAASGLSVFFEQVITSDASGYLKPNSEIFDYALRKSHARLTDSIMIGDNLDADIRGAQEFGMDTIFVNHIRETAISVKPTFTITHLKQLEAIF